MVWKLPLKVSRKSENSRISEMGIIQPKISEIPIYRTETPGKKFLKIWVYLARLSSFPEIQENAVPFDTGNFRKL